MYSYYYTIERSFSSLPPPCFDGSCKIKGTLLQFFVTEPPYELLGDHLYYVMSISPQDKISFFRIWMGLDGDFVLRGPDQSVLVHVLSVNRSFKQRRTILFCNYRMYGILR